MSWTRAEVLRPGELGDDLVRAWRGVQRADERLASPFLGPSFARLVGARREDARVAVLGGGEAFFAFHRGRLGAGVALGRTLADYQALVVAPGAAWSPPELLRACGLRSYAFDHLLVSQREWAPHVRAEASSPAVDLERFGPDDMPGEAGRKARRLERGGAPRFAWHDPDPASLAQLVRWKREQYARSGVYDIFGHAWVGELVNALHQAEEEDLTGQLGCLFDGDRLIAAHLAFRSGPVLHSWMPAHAPDRARDSPGLVLLRAILMEAPERGVRLFDFGKGDEDYKRRFANASVGVGAGSVQAGRPARLAARAGRAGWNVVNRTRLQGRAYRAGRRLQVG